MHEGVPICTDHDATVWHPLVQKSGSTITCTYGHEHHDNPNAVNDIFGQPSAWYGGAQAISYPWQTSSTAGQENHVKHEGYKWVVWRGMPCVPGATAAGDNGCITAYRAQVHMRGDVSDAVVRFHSYSIEAVVQAPDGRNGIVRHGGHLDFGHLALNVNGGNFAYCPPLASNPTTFSCGVSPERDHSSANVPAGYQSHDSFFSAWYSSHGITVMSVGFEEWGPMDAQNLTNQLFFPPARLGNNSRGGVGTLGVGTVLKVPPVLDANGRVQFNGYTNRAGVIVQGCTAPAVDCVPLKIEGAPPISSLWRKSQQPVDQGLDHDVPSPVTQRSLIRFPN